MAYLRVCCLILNIWDFTVISALEFCYSVILKEHAVMILIFWIILGFVLGPNIDNSFLPKYEWKLSTWDVTYNYIILKQKLYDDPLGTMSPPPTRRGAEKASGLWAEGEIREFKAQEGLVEYHFKHGKTT